MSISKVPQSELADRLARFRSQMDLRCPDWRMAAIASTVNIYYFTGTSQEGLLLVPREGEAVFWVRRSYERALDESLFPRIELMGSFRDAAQRTSNCPSTVHLETEAVPLASYQRMCKYFPFKEFRAADFALAVTRSVKSPYELALMEQAGEIHRRVMEERLPQMVRQEMSEADLGVALFDALMEEGHHGFVRFAGCDALVGYVGFGDSSLYPVGLDGPGGNRGLSPAMPLFGSRERKLEPGDLIFIDISAGVGGYHTDKTLTYLFDGRPTRESIEIQTRCVELQDRAAAMLVPGAIPSKIYRDIIQSLEPAFLENFMGFGNRRVKFLGHGIGLVVNEWPVIAEGFDEPLQEGMVMAIEPKKGIAGVGLLGIENTYIITPKGGRCITGPGKGLGVLEVLDASQPVTKTATRRARPPKRPAGNW